MENGHKPKIFRKALASVGWRSVVTSRLRQVLSSLSLSLSLNCDVAHVCCRLP